MHRESQPEALENGRVVSYCIAPCRVRYQVAANCERSEDGLPGGSEEVSSTARPRPHDKLPLKCWLPQELLTTNGDRTARGMSGKVLFTRATLCTARSLLYCGVRLCTGGFTGLGV